MSKIGCFLGVVFIFVAFVILFGLIVIPALPGAENNATITGILEPVLCKSGETLTQTTSVYHDSRGTTRSPHYYCGLEPNAQRDVTGKAILYGMVGFVGPFLAGLFLSMAGIFGLVRNTARKAINGTINLAGAAPTYQTSPDGVMTINASGVPIRVTTAKRTVTPDFVTSQTPISEKLQQLQTLLAQNLISQEEYDRLRGQILDESF